MVYIIVNDFFAIIKAFFNIIFRCQIFSFYPGKPNKKVVKNCLYC